MVRVRCPGLILLVLLMTPACGGGGGGGGPSGPGYPQTLMNIEPGEGTTAGGTTVILRGTGFLDEVRKVQGVRIGENLADDWEILDDNTIRLVTPAGPLGLAPLWILGDNSPFGDGVLLAAGFHYVAPVVYAADGAGAAQPQLYRIDLDTGNSQLVGPTGYGVQALARAPDGMLWASEGAPLFRLIRIDPGSAQGGPAALLQYAGTEDPVDVRDLAFLGARLIGRTAAEQLVEIDLALGACTVLAAVPGAGPAAGLAPTGTGRLYLAPGSAAEPVRSWDEVLGVFFSLGFVAPFDVASTMTRSAGVLYGCVQRPGGPELISLDPLSGAATTVAPLPSAVEGIARDR